MYCGGVKIDTNASFRSGLHFDCVILYRSILVLLFRG